MKNHISQEKSREELEQYLIEDTDNYSNLNSSKVMRAFDYDEKVGICKREIADLEKRIEEVRAELNRQIGEVEDMQADSPFARLTLASKKKKLIQEINTEFDKNLEILQHRLVKAGQELEFNRMRLQELISKIEAEGANFEELKRIIIEKRAQGLFDFQQASEARRQRREKADLYVSRGEEKQRSRSGTNNGEGGRTFKERNVTTIYDLYKIKGLTLAEKKELEEMYGHLIYADDKCPNPELAWQIRMALLSGKQKKYVNLALYTSNKMLFDNIFMYFVKDGGLAYQKDFERLYKGTGAVTTKKQFFGEKAYLMLNQSGYTDSFIKSHMGIYAKELEELFSKPSQMSYVLGRLSNYKEDSESMRQAFEAEVKREVNRRVEEKHNLKKLDCFGTSPSNSHGYEK